jgi:hypothetical protein
MAPKLIPDNLLLPDPFIDDLDRTFLDPKIFPVSHYSGQIKHKPGPHVKQYIPAPPIPSPYSNERFITDIKLGSEITFKDSKVEFVRNTDGDGSLKIPPTLRSSILSAVKDTKNEIEKLAETQIENLHPELYPGSDVEIMTFGTGSAIPSKYRNGTPS